MYNRSFNTRTSLHNYLLLIGEIYYSLGFSKVNAGVEISALCFFFRSVANGSLVVNTHARIYAYAYNDTYDTWHFVMAEKAKFLRL